MTKLISFLLVTFIMLGCSNLKEVPSYSLLSMVDFRKYSAEGFLITPEKFAGNYNSVGIIDYVKMPGAKYIVSKKLQNQEKYKAYDPTSDSNFPQWFIETINMDQALDEVYKQCKNLGANAIINFNIEMNSETWGTNPNQVNITGYRITGFAIKRL